MRNVKELLDLSGQVAIVTGGAEGIGKQMAYALGEAGATVIVASRKLENCEKVAQEMERELNTEVLPVRLDVTIPDEVTNIFDVVMEKYGRVDILINNSGATWGASTLDFPIKGWNKVIETNLTGSWLMAQNAGRIMAKQNYGRVIFISSGYALVGAPAEIMDSIAYVASKSALIGMTKDLAVKWAQYNITVNALLPGWYPSKMTRGTIEGNEEQMLRTIPLGRFGGDDDLKAATVFLASPGGAYCTGAIVPVDGGAGAM